MRTPEGYEGAESIRPDVFIMSAGIHCMKIIGAEEKKSKNGKANIVLSLVDCNMIFEKYPRKMYIPCETANSLKWFVSIIRKYNPDIEAPAGTAEWNERQMVGYWIPVEVKAETYVKNGKETQGFSFFVRLVEDYDGIVPEFDPF